jgi:hypothetical protein
MGLLLDQFKAKATSRRAWSPPELDELAPFQKIDQLLNGIAQDLRNGEIARAKLYPEAKWLPEKLYSQIDNNIHTLCFIFKFLQARSDKFLEHPLHLTDVVMPTFRRLYSLLLESMQFYQSWLGVNANEDLLPTAKEWNRFIHGPNALPIILNTKSPPIPVTFQPQDPTSPKIRTLFTFAILALLASLAAVGLRRFYFRQN